MDNDFGNKNTTKNEPSMGKVEGEKKRETTCNTSFNRAKKNSNSLTIFPPVSRQSFRHVMEVSYKVSKKLQFWGINDRVMCTKCVIIHSIWT